MVCEEGGGGGAGAAASSVVVVAARGLVTTGGCLMLLCGCFHRKASVLTESSVVASRKRPRERWRWHGAADDDDVLILCGKSSKHKGFWLPRAIKCAFALLKKEEGNEGQMSKKYNRSL